MTRARLCFDVTYKLKKTMPRRCCLVLAFALFEAVSAWAVDPNRYISRYAHTAWRASDGFYSNGIAAIAQTQDGYIWMATNDGLLRFDGVRFVPWKFERGEQLPSADILALVAASDGSLWIASFGGLSRLKNNTITNYRTTVAGSYAVFEDKKGRIWFAQGTTSEGAKHLCEVAGAETRCYGATDGVPSVDIVAVIDDRQGTLWVADTTTILRWTSRTHTVYQLPRPTVRSKGIHALASMPDGTLWVGIATAGPRLGLQRFADGRWSSFKTQKFDSSSLTVESLYEDREGTLWIGTFDHGIYRIRENDVDHFDSTDGLSSDQVIAIREDREGNLWVVTSLGIDRFADTAIVSFTSKEELCCPEADSVLASRDGAIWSGGDGALGQLRNTTVSCLRAGKELPGSQVTSLLEDHSGRLWAGVDEDLWVRENRTFRKIKRPDGRGVGFVTAIAEDTENSIWVTVNKPRRIMMRIEGLTVRQEYEEPRQPRKLAADPTGGIWIGLLNGDLAHYRNGKQETYRFPHSDAALVNQVQPLSDGSVLAATTYGLIGWRNGKTLQLTAKNGLPCEAVNAITFDKERNLWLYMACGLGEMTSLELQRWLRNPGNMVSIKTLDAFDGAKTGRSSFTGAATSMDGRLWFANGYFLQTLDPAHVRRNSVPPPVHTEQVIADRKTYSATGVVSLPARTRDLEIDYVALSFAAPQKVLFRYRLEGRDDVWQEAGTRRQAFYTDLRPGAYRFRVIACNNDGVWNEEGASLDFVLAAAFYQTVWFRTFCAVLVVAVLWGLYRYRLHQLSRQFNLRLEERVGERTRIARELHDTLLQSFQGLMFRLQAVDDLLPEGKAKDQLERTLERGDQAIAEGRTAVYDLRSSATTTNDLTQAVKSLGEELATTDSAAFRLVVEGVPRDLHPIVRDEIYRIAHEALRNAFSHAGAHHIETEITYAERALRLRIRDDGKGIPPEFLEEGRSGHYGLRGMRERARQIGGKLDIWSRQGAGAEIELTLAGGIAYRTPGGRFLSGIFRKKGEHA